MMKVLLATAEIAPWVHEGATGLAAAGLARALKSTGVHVRVIVPDYPVFTGLRGLTRGKKHPLKLSYNGALHRTAWTEAKIDGLELLLVEKPEFFDRAEIYGAPGETYEDNLARFSFFAEAVMEIAGAWSADLIHACDWPGALMAALRRKDVPPVSVGLHNLLYQGDFPTVQFPQTGLEWKDFGPFEFYGRGNAVKAGLLTASAVVFPGARMMHAVQTPGAGCGLEGVASSAAPRLHGILAGADYDGWFDARTKEARRRKTVVRKEWLAAMKLKPLEDDGLLAIYPLALSGGRGLDLLLPVLDRLMEFPLRVVVLGTPPLSMAPTLQLLMMRHPGQFMIHDGDDTAVLRAAAAAADALLVPDAIEPGDTRLPQAMRAGAVPLAQSLPGLHEIVQNYDASNNTGNGLVFYRHDPEALWDTFRLALQLRSVGAWDGLTERAAAMDFSWSGVAGRYAALFKQLVPHAS
jgi:starch synthase